MFLMSIKKAYTIIGILIAGITINCLLVAKDGEKDSREARVRAAESELKAAVGAGKISREDAIKRLEGLKKHLRGEEGHKKDQNDPRM